LSDIEAGKRNNDIVAKSIERIPLYENMPIGKIDTSNITPKQAAGAILQAMRRKGSNH
jgi:hypothetical protein